jgi:hypothetical protein
LKTAHVSCRQRYSPCHPASYIQNF